MQFELIQTDGAARRGRLNFERGAVETPAFMPVGTYGTVKAMTPEEVRELGADIILGNTFHLMLRPGVEVIRTTSCIGSAPSSPIRVASRCSAWGTCARSPRRA